MKKRRYASCFVVPFLIVLLHLSMAEQVLFYKICFSEIRFLNIKKLCGTLSNYAPFLIYFVVISSM